MDRSDNSIKLGGRKKSITPKKYIQKLIPPLGKIQATLHHLHRRQNSGENHRRHGWRRGITGEPPQSADGSVQEPGGESSEDERGASCDWGGARY